MAKDGPSAGVSIVTALVSMFYRRVVRYDTAMTGEITRTGHVLVVSLSVCAFYPRFNDVRYSNEWRNNPAQPVGKETIASSVCCGGKCKKCPRLLGYLGSVLETMNLNPNQI